MTQDNVVRIRPAVAVALAIALLSIGAATMYFLTRGREPGVAILSA